MNIFGYAQIIPSENRRELMQLRESLGAEKFLDHIWRERLKERLNALGFRHCKTRARGKYPIMRDADKPAKSNVSPIKRART